MDRKLRAALVAEAVGTCLFFIVGAGSIVLGTFAPPGPGLLGVALAHGLILAVMVSSLGAVSGGHFNPAVVKRSPSGRQDRPHEGGPLRRRAAHRGRRRRRSAPPRVPGRVAGHQHRCPGARGRGHSGYRHRPRGDHDRRPRARGLRNGGRPARAQARRTRDRFRGRGRHPGRWSGDGCGDEPGTLVRAGGRIRLLRQRPRLDHRAAAGCRARRDRLPLAVQRRGDRRLGRLGAASAPAPRSRVTRPRRTGR